MLQMETHMASVPADRVRKYQNSPQVTQEIKYLLSKGHPGSSKRSLEKIKKKIFPMLMS